MRRAGATAVVMAISLLLLVIVAPTPAQYRDTVQVDAVIAPVTVRNSSGRIVTDVSPKKFHLFIDGMEVNIEDVAPENDLPMSLGFILDTSGSMAGRKIRGCQGLINAFLQHRRKEDQLALWTFGNDRVMERFPFGMGWYLLPRILETIKPWSTTALYDMIQRVPEVMERATHPRRASILLTDGVDNASKIGPDEATGIAQSLRTPIYVLGVEPPPLKVAGGVSYEKVLELIANQSGGHYQRIPSAEEMPEVVTALVDELSSRYIVSFMTSGVGVSKWRTIEIRVDGYQANTRSGYMGTLP